MSTDNTTAHDTAARRLADVRAGRPYTWNVDVYGTGLTVLTLSKNGDDTFILEETRTDLGGQTSTVRNTIKEAEALTRLGLIS